MNWIRIAILPILLVLLTGCFQSDTAIYLNPDGSGRVEITNLMSAEMVEMMSAMSELEPAGEEGQDDADASDGSELFSVADAKAAVAQMGEGVRFKSIEAVEKDGFSGSVAIYEFEDITKLRLDAKPDAMPADPEAGDSAAEIIAFAFEKSGGTSRLSVRMPDAPPSSDEDASDVAEGAEYDAEDKGEPGEAELEMMRGMLDGIKFGVRIIPAGKLVKTNSIHVEGNEVTIFEIDFGALVQDISALQKLASQDEPDSFADISNLLKDLPGIKINPVEEITIEFK